MPYKLSATLTAHSSDVRAVASPADDLVLSSSRDASTISWRRQPSSPSFEPVSVYRAGTRYVNAVAYVPPGPDSPQGYVASAGQEAVINLFSLGSPSENPDYSLIGHTDNVCTLDVGPGGAIISGSWDRTAKVWKNFQLAHDLEGHQASVWAVVAINEQQFLTGSADKTIKLWEQHKQLRTFSGHRDAVRGLVLIPDIGFASCSNDSEIRVWTMEGDAIYILSGHTSFVYSLSLLPNGDIISGGEDRTVRVWRDGEPLQTIVHPAISVWAVSSMPNGDIVSGCSDGVVRVFSASEERWAAASDLKEYEEKVASQALPTQQIGDVKKTDLPGLEALNVPGKKEGEVKMVKNMELVEAHQWDASSGTWMKIGEVVDAVGSGRKQLYEGKEYDYVFDVDIKDGAPPLKLPYNVTENPHGAAQRFLHRNELPLTYVDEVVAFIEKNTAGVNIGTGGNEYVDPYTGASRYQSSASSVPTAGSAYVDPYTGNSRYVSTAAAAPPAATSNNQYMDPFTGASRYSGAPQPTQAAAIPSVLPVIKFLNFKQGNVPAMQAKIASFKDLITNEKGAKVAMTAAESSSVENIFKYLTEALSPSPPSTCPIGSQDTQALVSLLTRWPLPQRFPLIDLARLVAGFCPLAVASPGVQMSFLEALFKAGEWDNAPWQGEDPSLTKGRETNGLLMLRTLANMFQEGTEAGEWVLQVLVTLPQAPYAILNKNQRVALATILFNLSCISLSSPLNATVRSQHQGLVLQVLKGEKTDSEPVYRALVALGNIVYASKINQTSIGSSQSTEIRMSIGPLPGIFNEDRVKGVVNEINALL